MSATPLVAQQPRWLLLLAFLFMWSLSSGLRRDGSSRAHGLGVDARAHMPVADNLVLADEPEEYSPPGIWRRQVGIPNCAALCASQASNTVGCGQGINVECACHSPTFLPDTVNCMDKNCTSIDEQLGLQALQDACKAVGTSSSSPPSTSTSFSASSTLISSGPPPICTTGSPTSSATTTVSVTVTITSSASDSSASGTGSGSVSSTTTSTPFSSQSPSGSVPVVTTTSMLTTSSTVVLPTSSATSPPVTTVTSTSTLGSAPSSETSGDAGVTGTGGGIGDGSTNGAAPAPARSGKGAWGGAFGAALLVYVHVCAL
ncbi:hypothetical protein BN946_scf184985.g106 [Trametes cinnabarina]|uniref:CFEM domain-containing protein n=1 Tax=Pycnoporus cinnabarinus TaxID=5643 RepID=A0A060SEN1_PYCCI|nr:hypothetical protein BN946_scf184985.g106 [Trametes cinnabarina]